MSQSDESGQAGPDLSVLPEIYRCPRHGTLVVYREEGCVMLQPHKWPGLEEELERQSEKARSAGLPLCEICKREREAEPTNTR